MTIKPMIKIQDGKENLKAYADVVLDESIMIKGISVVDGKNGLFLNMPSRKGADGNYYDQVYPITKEFREELTKSVIDEYQHQLDKKMGQTAEPEKAEKQAKTAKTAKAPKAKEPEMETPEPEPEATPEQTEEQDAGMAMSM